MRSFALLLIFTTGCATADLDQPAYPAEVQEAVLRWAFVNAETDLDSVAVYCVAAQSSSELPQDPDERLLEALRPTFPVRPASGCVIEQNSHRSVIDPETRRHGLLFQISQPEWEDSTAARVNVMYIQGGLWGACWQCTVRRSATAGWQVDSCERTCDI